MGLILISSCSYPYKVSGNWGYFAKNEEGKIKFVYIPKVKIAEETK